MSNAAETIALAEPVVTRLGEGFLLALENLLHERSLQLQLVAEGKEIPGSFWGDTEAGLIGNTLYVRHDTPVHSALHETCHWLCMDAARRSQLHTDARSDEAEEQAVCYLQTVLAEQLPNYSRAQLFIDMDAWGYNFFFGSAQAWYNGDSAAAREWLVARSLIA